jgi:hypothetical protein
MLLPSPFGGTPTKLRFFARSAAKRTIMEWIFTPNETSGRVIQDQFEYDGPSPDRCLSRMAHCNHDVNIQIEYTILFPFGKDARVEGPVFSNSNSADLPIQNRICVTMTGGPCLGFKQNPNATPKLIQSELIYLSLFLAYSDLALSKPFFGGPKY